ncbi:ATP-dependent RNA helicase DDX42, partial [Ophiophagus hannah]
MLQSCVPPQPQPDTSLAAEVGKSIPELTCLEEEFWELKSTSLKRLSYRGNPLCIQTAQHTPSQFRINNITTSDYNSTISNSIFEPSKSSPAEAGPQKINTKLINSDPCNDAYSLRYGDPPDGQITYIVSMYILINCRNDGKIASSCCAMHHGCGRREMRLLGATGNPELIFAPAFANNVPNFRDFRRREGRRRGKRKVRGEGEEEVGGEEGEMGRREGGKEGRKEGEREGREGGEGRDKERREGEGRKGGIEGGKKEGEGRERGREEGGREGGKSRKEIGCPQLATGWLVTVQSYNLPEKGDLRLSIGLINDHRRRHHETTITTGSITVVNSRSTCPFSQNVLERGRKKKEGERKWGSMTIRCTQLTAGQLAAV